MKLIAMTLASLSLLASSVAQAGTAKRTTTYARSRQRSKSIGRTPCSAICGSDRAQPARSQRCHAFGTDHAQSDCRNGGVSQSCARQRREAGRSLRDHHPSRVLRGLGNAMAAVAGAKDVFAARKIAADQLPPASPQLLALNESAEADRAKRVGELFGAVFPGVTQYTTDISLPRSLAAARPCAARPEPCDDQFAGRVRAGAQLNGHIPIGMNNGLTQAGSQKP